jgi:DNA-directed RNA polymerase subunit N (RpoN/RPB10)
LKNLDTFLKATPETQDIVLDRMGYTRICCRRMFLGYPRELDQGMALYDFSKINGDPANFKKSGFNNKAIELIDINE